MAEHRNKPHFCLTIAPQDKALLRATANATQRPMAKVVSDLIRQGCPQIIVDAKGRNTLVAQLTEEAAA